VARRGRIWLVRRDSRATIWAGWRGAVRLGAGRFELRRPSSVRLASLAQHSRGATASGRWRRARRSGFADKGMNFWFRGCIRRPVGHPPGPTTRTRTRRATASREGLPVPLNGKRQRQGELSPCHSQRIARWGACRKTRVVAQNRRPMPQPAEMGARRACVVVDVWGTR
jgi:hypothetical protein